MNMQARLNLWQPRWTADRPAADKTPRHGPVMTSHPTRGTMWIVTGEVDKGRSLKRERKLKERLIYLFSFFFRDLLIISDLPLPSPRSQTINYVIITFSSFYLFSLFGASVSLLPAWSLHTEAWLSGECLPVCLLLHTLSGQYIDLLRGKIIHTFHQYHVLHTKSNSY